MPATHTSCHRGLKSARQEELWPSLHFARASGPVKKSRPQFIYPLSSSHSGIRYFNQFWTSAPSLPWSAGIPPPRSVTVSAITPVPHYLNAASSSLVHWVYLQFLSCPVHAFTDLTNVISSDYLLK
jgi:hypothetical protein